MNQRFFVRFARIRTVALLLLLGLLLAAVPHAAAQPPGGGIPTTLGGTSTGAVRTGSTESGELTMEVNIWGQVRTPGKYTVPISTRLVDLISLAGGPAERADLEEVKVVHDILTDSTIKQTVVVFNVEDYQTTGNPGSNPILGPNDTVIIPGDTLNGVNQILSVVSNVAVVTISVIGLIFAINK